MGAIIASGGLATPLVALAWTAGAATVAVGATAVGTVALNKHYGRQWNENLLKNVAFAGVAAAVVTGGWFALQAASTGIGAYCAVNQATCTRVEPVFNTFDAVEETSLSVKLAVQTWRGDQVSAAETALELQMEHLDGGMPGNVIAKEVKDELLEIIEKHSDDVSEVITKYGDDGFKLISLYKEDVFNFIKRAEKQGVNPTEILDNPPLPGQTVEGWILDIDNTKNPVNMPLKFNMQDSEIVQLRKKSIQNPDSKLFSIGYGRDAKIPFDKMANTHTNSGFHPAP